MTEISAPQLVILDRDGVINFDSPDYIRSPDDWRPLPGALEAIGRLNAANRTVVVATNQSGIGRALFSEETLSDIHQKMLLAAQSAGAVIDRIYYCPHAPWAGCECRKPRPGLLLQAQLDYSVKASEVVFIGDHLSDVHAALNAGMQPVLVGDAETKPVDAAIPRLPDLGAAVDALLADEEIGP